MRVAIVMLLFSATVAHAGTAEVAAALQGEAAECRYLLGLCKRADKITDMAIARTPGVTTAMAQLTLNDLYEAAPVIRSKHGKMPKCFRQCVDGDGQPLIPLKSLE